jgi:DNA-binding Xre family transcriptional regulator
VAKIVSKARALRLEYAARLGRNVTVEEAGTAMGIHRKRLTALELGSFDELSNRELIAFCEFYSRVLERPINIEDLLRYDPNNRRATMTEAQALPA